MTQRLVGPAREQLLADARNLYALGLTIREIAAQLGYSYGAVRAQLLASGVALRPKHGGRAAWGEAGDPVAVACPRCGRRAGKACVQVGYGRPRQPHLQRRRAATR